MSERSDAAGVEPPRVGHARQGDEIRSRTDDGHAVPARRAGSRRSSLREEQRELTRTRLMDAALEVFGRSGYTSATVDEIAAVADVSRATFYVHFRTKLDLVAALIAKNRPEVISYYVRADEVFASGDSAAIQAWIRDALAYFDRNRTLTLVINQVLSTEQSRAADLGIGVDYSEYMPKMTSHWPLDSREEASTRVRMMISLLDRVWILWKTEGYYPKVNEEAMIRILGDIWLTTLTPPSFRGDR